MKSFIRSAAAQDLHARIDAVKHLCRQHGHINRGVLSQEMEVTKLQASQLLREFLHAHAPAVYYDTQREGYVMR